MQNYPLEVIWTGAVTDLSGYASASRGYVISLLEAGIDVSLDPRSFEPWKPNHVVEEIVERRIWGLIGKERTAKIHIIHLTPDLYHEYNHPERIKVGTFAWETDRIPASWVAGINNVIQELWVPCDYIKNACLRSGVTIPIYVIPHAIPLPPSDWQPSCVLKGLRKDDFNFYGIFQWSGRKNPEGLLQAYMEEFSKEENVTLIIKTYRRSDNITERDKIRRSISQIKRNTKGIGSPRILLIEELLTDAEIKALHYYCDCYVSMARAEGFGLPAFEALSFGTPVIVPAYSAFDQFLTDKTAYKVKIAGEVSVENMRHISLLYTGDMKWGNPDIVSCRKLMRKAFEEREDAVQKGLAGREYIKQSLSYKEIGRQMKSRIEALLKEHK